MKALVKKDDGLGVFDVKKPRPGPEAVIRVIMSGICNTDLEIAKGYADFTGTLGHEFIGIVEESSEDESWTGKRVVGEINVGCLTCEWCLKYDARHCPNRTVLGIIGRDGSHAEFLTLPVRNLVEVPEDVTDERAVFAEPLAAAYGILEQVEIKDETKVAVIGDGKLGILCAWALGSKTQHLFLIGKHPNKLRIGELGNAEGVLVGQAGSMNRGFDVVVEASGAESGFRTALELVKPRGKVVLKSTFHGDSEWEAWKVVVNEITVVGSRCGLFAPAVNLLKDKSLRLEELISDELPLEQGVLAFERASRGGVMKVLLRP